MDLSQRSITGAKTEYRKNNYAFAKHLHTTIEVYLIEKGTCYMELGQECINCTAGDFVLVLPHIVHSFYVKENDECVFQHIHFKGDLFSELVLSEEGEHSLSFLNALIFSCNSYYRQKADSIMKNCLENVIALYREKQTVLTLTNINFYLLELVLHIFNKQKKLSDHSELTEQNSYVAFTLNYIEKNYMSKIVQSEIANTLHISVRYLSELFKRYMGITLSRYINVYRINKSIELMEETEMSLTEIALAIGLSSSQHFSKLFKEIINMTPLHYRAYFLESPTRINY